MKREWLIMKKKKQKTNNHMWVEKSDKVKKIKKAITGTELFPTQVAMPVSAVQSCHAVCLHKTLGHSNVEITSHTGSQQTGSGSPGSAGVGKKG